MASFAFVLLRLPFLLLAYKLACLRPCLLGDLLAYFLVCLFIWMFLSLRVRPFVVLFVSLHLLVRLFVGFLVRAWLVQ